MEAQKPATMDQLTTLSHELRTPLTVIKGYVSTLISHEKQLTRTERLEFLRAIQQASAKLETVVDQVLEVQQLVGKAVRLEYTSVDLFALIHEVIIDIQCYARDIEYLRKSDDLYAIEHKNAIQFIFNGNPSGLPGERLIIQADRVRLKKVLKNLLENALLYSPMGGRIEIGIQTVLACKHKKIPFSSNNDGQNGKENSLPATQRMIEIWIRDNGIGIEAQYLQDIFECFYRVDTRLTREVNGLGFGLAFCKRIIELHQGSIWAESEFGKGSIFHVLLPVG